MTNFNPAKFNYTVLTLAAFCKVTNAVLSYYNFGHITKIIDLFIYFICLVCTVISFRLFILKERKKLNKRNNKKVISNIGN